MEILFKENLSTDISERKEFLLNHKISIYDSIYKCDIIGSSDATIQNVEVADLSEIFKKAKIEEVFCNGKTSYKYYKKYHSKKFGIKEISLPSTSPANARYRLDDLVNKWKDILEYV